MNCVLDNKIHCCYGYCPKRPHTIAKFKEQYKICTKNGCFTPLVELINMAEVMTINEVTMEVDRDHKEVIKLQISPLTLLLPNNIENFKKAQELLNNLHWGSLRTDEKDVKGSLYS